MPNFDRPGKDMPSRRDIQEMDRESRRREIETNALNKRVEDYLRNHPDASYAEAEYKTRR